MIHDRLRIIRSDTASDADLFFLRHELRFMNPFCRHGSQFRHVASQIMPIRIEFFTLERWVKDAIPLHRIRSGRGTPLPVSVVGRHISIHQVLHEVSLAALPIDPKVLDQKRRHHHTHTIMHPACLIQLAHAGIHNRISGTAFTPGRKEPVALRTGRTRSGKSRLDLERPFGDMGKGHQHLLKKFSPDQFVHPGEHVGAGYLTAFGEGL